MRYFALAGTYLPTEQGQQAVGVFNRMLDGAFDQFFKDTENDLVVAASSVLTVHPDCDVISKVACDHSNYFSATTMDNYYPKLLDWLKT